MALRLLSKISVKYAKISQNIRQISLNFSQNFVPAVELAVAQPVAALHRCALGGRVLKGVGVDARRVRSRAQTLGHRAHVELAVRRLEVGVALRWSRLLPL